jgi:hypothetical protein
MSSARRLLCGVYVAVAVIALLGTWRQNIAFMQETGLSFFEGFVAFWPALLVNRATVSVTVDIFVLGLAAVIWMVLEARRLQIKFVWLYVLFSMTVAISAMFPLFLVARERRLAEHAADTTEPAPTMGDKVGLGLFAAGIVAFTVWRTFQ